MKFIKLGKMNTKNLNLVLFDCTSYMNYLNQQSYIRSNLFFKCGGHKFLSLINALTYKTVL